MAAPNHPTVPHKPIPLLTGDYYIQARTEPKRYVAVDERIPMFPRKLVTLPEGTEAPIVRL